GGLQLAWIRERGLALSVAGACHGIEVDGDRVVDTHHDEVARVRALQHGPDRRQLVEDLLDPDRPAGSRILGPADALRDEARGDAGLAAAEVAILADDDLVEGPCRVGAV